MAAEVVAPQLEQFILPWCNSLRNIRDDVEKVRSGAAPTAQPAAGGSAGLLWEEHSAARGAHLTGSHRRPRPPFSLLLPQEHAFRGLCEMIKLNPRGTIAHFVNLCDAIASWQQPPAQLDEAFRQILTGYKSSVAPEAWAQYYGTFPEYMRARLTQRYGI